MTAPPLSDESRALLHAFSVRVPGPVRAEANWSAVQARLSRTPHLSIPHRDADEDADEAEAEVEHDGAHDDVARRPGRGGSPWPRWILSAAVSVAIAAAVLLTLRVVVGAGRRAWAEAVDVGTQAADAAQGKASGTATPRAITKVRSASPAPTVPAPTPTPDPAATVVVPTQPDVPAKAAATTEAPQPKGASASALAEEVELLVQARRALAQERFADAHQLAAGHRTRFPRGTLREEAHAIEAIAGCVDGQGTAAAQTFLTTYPGSPHAPRVRAACPTE